MNRRRFLPGIALALVLVLLGLGALWTARNLGDVPSYGDTREYLVRARTLRVDQYRGIAYPLILAAANRLWPGETLLDPGLLERCPRGESCAVMRGFVPVQLLQAAVSLAALAYAAWSLGAGGRGAAPLVLLVALLWLDPLVSHFHIAIMTDGLALSASLAFCAAWGSWVVGRGPTALAVGMLVASQLLATTLRTEKGFVFAVTALASALAGLVVARRATGSWIDPPARRGLVACAVVLGVALTAASISRGFLQHDLGRWPARTWLLQQRIVYPHLASVYDDLSPAARSVISRRAAETYDRSIVNVLRVINKVTRRDARTREWLTEELARASWHAHGPEIVRDVVGDGLENTLATFSFYARLGLWAARGADPVEVRERFEGSTWTWSKLSHHHPELSRVYVVAAATLLLLALAPAVLAAAAALRSRGGQRASALAVAPFGAFVLANAAAFALTANLVNIRYTLFAHVMILFAVYGGAIAWFVGRDRPDAG